MFDNFTPEDTRKAVEIVGGRCETESSGGITYDTMLPYACLLYTSPDFLAEGQPYGRDHTMWRKNQ